MLAIGPTFPDGLAPQAAQGDGRVGWAMTWIKRATIMRVWRAGAISG
jgi:hypothetical protein